jgi:hypothetical protein
MMYQQGNLVATNCLWCPQSEIVIAVSKMEPGVREMHKNVARLKIFCESDH